MFASDHEGGSPALPCDSSPPSPVAPSLHSLSVPAGVASHSTHWATTEQRAQGLGFWARGDGLSRALQLASAVREAVVSHVLVRDLDLALVCALRPTHHTGCC